MANEKAKTIFAKYNRASDVVRCPNGKAATRKQLNAYARAAVNLYGIISRDDFVDIFNQQNNEQISSEEIYTLLLPLVLKEGWYCFYKNYIVHYLFTEALDHAEYLLKHQEDKPRNLPEKDEFLKYFVEDYEDNDHWWNVRRFMWDTFGYGKDTSEGYAEVKQYIVYGDGISKLGDIMDKHHLVFDGEKQLQAFVNLIMTAKNNTRIWHNNGYTPSELSEIMSERNKNSVDFPTFKKTQVGRNEPCPCGSGKKYKKCCALLNDVKTAQLSSEECKLFYETWFGLMNYVNERKRVIEVKIKPEYPNSVSDGMIYKVREVFWKTPELIDDYLSETVLPQEKIDILKLWIRNYKKGMFFVLAYQPEYTVLLGTDEHGEDRLYGIKGISKSLEIILNQSLPTQIETILLPFKGKIIYDSYVSSLPMHYGEGAKASFRMMYDQAIKHGIVTSLE